MTTARITGTGIGIGMIVLLWFGASAFSSGQQTGQKAAAPAPPAPERRERVLKLQTEVELLQLEFDGTRAALVKWLEGVGQADLMGIDLSALWGTMKLELGGITGDAATLREMSELTTKLDANDPESARKAVQATAQKGKKELQAAFDRKKQEFAKLARRLHETKLDLADAERIYERENR